MEARAAAIADGKAAELVWLLEHPPLYTAGTSAKAGRPDRPALPGVRHRARRAVHLSRPRPAGGLCDARPEAARQDVRAFVAAWRNGSSARSTPSTCAASGARTASGSGSGGPTRAPATRTRSPPSASGCAAGCPSTASPQCRAGPRRIFPASCPAASDPLRRHQPGRPRPAGDDGRPRRRAQARLRRSVRRQPERTCRKQSPETSPRPEVFHFPARSHISRISGVQRRSR